MVVCPDQMTIARLRSGFRQPQILKQRCVYGNSAPRRRVIEVRCPCRFQVAISDIVVLHSLYCVEPPMARMRVLYTVPGVRLVRIMPLVLG